MKDRLGVSYIFLFFITVLGALIRFNNISPFKIYPDSYQNLLVSENIRLYHSVLGYLGSNGMLYPDFFMWTRPGYALLILIADAQVIAFLAGVIAIPLTFFFIKSTLGSKIAGLAGALLLTISFNHTIWSGFIMTETTGVLFMTMTLLSLFSSLKRKPSWMDFLTGLLFSFAVMSRYEYVVILLPVSVLIFFTNTLPYRRILSILSAFFISTLIVAMQLFPLQSVFVLFKQLPDLIGIGAGLGVVAVLVIIKKYSSSEAKAESNPLRQGYEGQGSSIALPKLMRRRVDFVLLRSNNKLNIEWLFLIVIFIIIVVGKGAISSFTTHDFFISSCFLFGIIFMIRNPSQRVLGFFVLFSMVALGAFYYRTNPDMERYMTHLLPFLIIPASYGLSQINYRRIPLVFLFMLVAIIQGFFSFGGLRYLHDDSWYRVSYEEKAAGMVRNYVSHDALLLVSLPEPYFYTLHTSTHSVADAAPFVYIPDSLNKKEILIVEDMGMHEVFPAFTTFLDTKMQDKKVTQFWVNEKFHILNKSKEEKYPVVIYKTSVAELKKRIKLTAKPQG